MSRRGFAGFLPYSHSVSLVFFNGAGLPRGPSVCESRNRVHIIRLPFGLPELEPPGDFPLRIVFIYDA